MNASPDPVLQAAVRQHLLDRITAGRDDAETTLPTTARPWFRVSVTALVLAATVVASVVTIQAAQQTRHRPTPAQHMTVTPPATPTPAQFKGLITTATGTLTGTASGTVHLTSEPDGGFRIQVDATRVDGLRTRHVELATSLRDVDCLTENDTDRSRGIDFGSTDVSRPTTVHRPPINGNDFGDLSFMTVLVLTPDSGANNNDYCTPSKMGVAKLTWDRPATYRALRATDHGRDAGADGTVRLHIGRPQSYAVAPDDQLDAVAARFGLTAQEVLYLNPRRQHGSDRMLYADETLNLDTDSR